MKNILLALLLLSSSTAVVAQAPPTQDLEHVGRRYQKTLEIKAPVAVPDHVTGVVIDTQGQPVADVTVTLKRTDRTSFSEKTTPDGRFDFSPVELDGKLSFVEVTGPDIERAALSPSVGDSLVFRIGHALNDDFWRDLDAEKNPRARLWMVLDVVRRRDAGMTPEVEQFFPHIGDIRPQLIAIAQSPAFKVPGQHASAPDQRALALLAMWGDPADDALNPPAIGSAYHPRNDPRLSGASLEESCARWIDIHMKGLGLAPMSGGHLCRPRSRSKAGDHVAMTFSQDHESWGYTIEMFASRVAGRWRIHFIGDETTYHYDY